LPLILTSSVAVNYGSKMSTKGWPVQGKKTMEVEILREAVEYAQESADLWLTSLVCRMASIIFQLRFANSAVAHCA
ncbi:MULTISPECIES: hypothetical protein, partial [unclassified Burkholderia]